MLFILAVVVALVAWALHLMQQAIDKQEFSLMLAGLLVSSAAAALVGVYVLMNNCMATMTKMSQPPYYSDYSEPIYIEQVYEFSSDRVPSQIQRGVALLPNF